ncbi:hypothetical protein [Brevundimonas sp. TWP1-2-1b1]|uniref:hypothetical protein n=1 Tax=unclassified Brevundimonas TaxID=2622653 RepID=UPI003CF13BB7
MANATRRTWLERNILWLFLGGLTALIAAWLLLLPLFLYAQARLKAGATPYCLYVPNPHDYGTHQVTQLRELAWPREHKRCGGAGPCDWKFEFHAVLSIADRTDNSLYNWSYSQLGFRPITPFARQTLHHGQDRCTPRRDFLGGLPW